MRENKILLLDVDGVLAASDVPVVAEVNKRYGTKLRPENINGWNWVQEQISEKTGDSRAGESALGIWYEPEVLYRAEPIDGAQAVVRELTERGWKAWVATSRKPNCEESTREWLQLYFPGVIAGVCVRIAECERWINSWQIKLMAAALLEAREYVEDDVHTVTGVRNNWPVGLPVPRIHMPDRGWNRNADDPEVEKLRVLGGWLEIRQRILAG